MILTFPERNCPPSPPPPCPRSPPVLRDTRGGFIPSSSGRAISSPPSPPLLSARLTPCGVISFLRLFFFFFGNIIGTSSRVPRGRVSLLSLSLSSSSLGSGKTDRGSSAGRSRERARPSSRVSYKSPLIRPFVIYRACPRRVPIISALCALARAINPPAIFVPVKLSSARLFPARGRAQRRSRDAPRDRNYAAE